MPKANDSSSEVRELVNLDVSEVSLVDRAAIKRTFLVVKRHDQEPTMTEAEKKTAADKAASEKAAAEKAAAEKAEAEKAAAEKAASEKAASEKADAEKAFGKPDEEEEKKKAAADLCIATLSEKMKSDPDNAASYEAGIAAFSKAFGKPDEEEEEEKKKAAGSDLDSLVKAAVDQALKSKAEKAEEEKAAAEKAATEKAATEKAATDSPDIAEMIKAAVTAALTPVTKAMGVISERVEVVAKTRGASKAEGDDGKSVVEKSSSLFSGIV